MYAEDELLPLSGIQHFSFCKRQWALIHVECQWRENLDTTLGQIFHERAHLVGYSVVRGVVARRSMMVVSHRLGLVGYSDVVEFIPCQANEGILVDGAWRSPRPVEYKKGHAKAGECDRLQVAAQALCLEEMLGCAVQEGFLFYGETRRREAVPVDSALRESVEALAGEMHALFAGRCTPPAIRRPFCARCSLTNECMPEVFGADAKDYWKAMGIEWGIHETLAEHAVRDDAAGIPSR